MPFHWFHVTLKGQYGKDMIRARQLFQMLCPSTKNQSRFESIYWCIYVYIYVYIYIYINIGWLCLLNWTTVQSNEYEKGTWQHLFCSTHVLFRMVSRGFTVRPTVCNLFGPRPDDLWFGGILCPGLRLPMKVVRFAIPNMIKLLVFRVYQFRQWVCYIDMNFLC